MRQVVLDTETTGLEPARGHRVLEVGAVEIIDRRVTGEQFHRHVYPQRDIDDAAAEIHGLTLERLQGAPKFDEIAEDFLAFVRGAELIIHNAPFDESFINYELSLLEDAPDAIGDICKVTDSLALARHKHPGQQNNLDALCRRYGVDNSERRELHGALLDAEILADVYLLMTGGQTSLFTTDLPGEQEQEEAAFRLPEDRPRLVVVHATAEERATHEARLDAIDARCEGGSVWRRLAPAAG